MKKIQRKKERVEQKLRRPSLPEAALTKEPKDPVKLKRQTDRETDRQIG